MRRPKQIVREMLMNFDVSRSSWFGPSWNAIRGMFADAFFKKPLMQGSSVHLDLARALYRNQADEYRYGAGFVRPIIDLPVEYMGIPTVSGTADDSFLNECVTDYWAPQLQEMFRDAIRDSKVIVRYRQPSALNPLFTEPDRMRGKIEIVPPEEADLTYSPSDPDFLERAAFTHNIDIDTRSANEVIQGTAPRMETHEIVEVITPERYTYYDKSAGAFLTSWETRNTWKFVPVWTVYNEYAADLGGGQSDIEPILPFVQAFHEVLSDTLAAHKYHSIPKAKFNVANVDQFIKNNWPEIYDNDTGKIKDGAKINWSGKEIMFFNKEEDADFIEATSVLGDSKTLLEFLIDCICIAAETPRWAIMSGTSTMPETDASVSPFTRKIERKRNGFQLPLTMLCKMALKANGKTPTTPRFSWPAVQTHDLVTKGQAIQQIIMGLDAAAAHEWLADKTAVAILATLFDEIHDPEEEMAAAANNIVPAVAPPAPASSTQGAQSSNGSTSNNGAKSKKAAKRALSTSGASNS